MTPREIIAAALADAYAQGEGAGDGTTDADAVLAALTDAGIVLGRWKDDDELEFLNVAGTE